MVKLCNIYIYTVHTGNHYPEKCETWKKHLTVQGISIIIHTNMFNKEKKKILLIYLTKTNTFIWCEAKGQVNGHRGGVRQNTLNLESISLIHYASQDIGWLPNVQRNNTAALSNN